MKSHHRITVIGNCPDCGFENIDVNKKGKYKGLCPSCTRRKERASSEDKEYIPFKNLDELTQLRISQREVNNTYSRRKLLEQQTNSELNKDDLIELQNYECDIDYDTLNILYNMKKFKEMLDIVVSPETPQKLIKLNQALTTIVHELQVKWEKNDFRNSDGIKLQNFILKQKRLKPALVFFSKFYESNAPLELQIFLDKYKKGVL